MENVWSETAGAIIVSQTVTCCARFVTDLALTINQDVACITGGTFTGAGAIAGGAAGVTRRTFGGWVQGRELNGKSITFLAVFVGRTSSGAITITITVASAVYLIFLIVPANTVNGHAVSINKFFIIWAFGAFPGIGARAFNTARVTDGWWGDTLTI